MNKGDLVEALEAKLGSRKGAVDAVETLIDTIVRTVAKGERVAISGFGTFEKAARAARTGRNPRTGQTVKIRKTSVPKFKPGTAFKAYVASPSSMPKGALGTGAVTSRVSKAAPATKTTSRATATRGAAKATKATKTTKAPARSTAKATPAKSASNAAPARAAAKKAPVTRSAPTVKKAPAKAPARAATKRTARKA